MVALIFYIQGANTPSRQYTLKYMHGRPQAKFDLNHFMQRECLILFKEISQKRKSNNNIKYITLTGSIYLLLSGCKGNN